MITFRKADVFLNERLMTQRKRLYLNNTNILPKKNRAQLK